MVAKTIRELLGRRPVISISPEATLEAACDLMAAENVGVLPVIEGHALCGLIIERDVIRHVSQCGGFETAKVADAMTRNVVCIETRDCIVEAVARMRAGGFSHLPVIDLGRAVIGLLSIRDIPAEYRVLHHRYSGWAGPAMAAE